MNGYILDGRNEKDRKEMERRLEEGAVNGLNIPRDQFIYTHDLFASVLNLARKASNDPDNHEGLSMEELAGRALVVSVVQMEEYLSNNPDVFEELITSAQLQKDRMMGRQHVDTMYG